MKKIIIIDGGPRKNFNTASMLQKFAEGVMTVGDKIEVKTVRLKVSTIRVVCRVWPVR